MALSYNLNSNALQKLKNDKIENLCLDCKRIYSYSPSIQDLIPNNSKCINEKIYDAGIDYNSYPLQNFTVGVQVSFLI